MNEWSLNLVHSVEEVLLSGHLPSRPDQMKINLVHHTKCILNATNANHHRLDCYLSTRIISQHYCSPDGEHASLRADTAELSAGGVGTQSRQQLVPNVLLDAH